MQAVRDFVTDPEALQVITQKNSPSLDLLDFKAAGGFLGLTLLSMIGMIGAGIGGLMSVYNATQNVADAQRSSKVASAADQLLGSIDLGLTKAPGKQPPKFVEELKPSVEKPAPEVKVSPAPESKTAAVMAELSQALKDKVSDIDVRLKALGQIASKLRHSVKTLQDKSAQMRSDSTEQADETYHVSSSAGRSSPLDQLQDAFFALKQQGVRLYLAILDNHSSKQLAIETEQLNLLVERVETTVSKMRSTLASTFDQASESKSSSPQVAPEIIELINMDANQVMRDLEQWQDEFDGLGKAVVGLKQEVKA
jgi:predicted  nucleic acid-binding Zn-ribbon protein